MINMGASGLVGDVENRNPTHHFSTPVNIKSCSICRHFTVFPMLNYPLLQFDPHPLWVLGWTMGIENNTKRNLIPTLKFDFCTPHWPILHSFGAMYV